MMSELKGEGVLEIRTPLTLLHIGRGDEKISVLITAVILTGTDVFDWKLYYNFVLGVL